MSNEDYVKMRIKLMDIQYAVINGPAKDQTLEDYKLEIVITIKNAESEFEKLKANSI